MNYSLGNTIYGKSGLEISVQNVLSKDGLKSDLKMNGHRIINLGYPSDNKDAASKQYVLDTFVQSGQPGQLAPLNVINDALPLSGTLDLTKNSNKTLVNNPTDSKGAVNKQSMESYVSGYVSDFFAQQQTQGSVVDQGYVDQSSINAVTQATQNSNSYTNTYVDGNYAHLDLTGNISGIPTSTGGHLSLNKKGFSETPGNPYIGPQWHLYGLPDVDLSDDSYRNLSQPLSAWQLQYDFCSTAQKNDIITSIEQKRSIQNGDNQDSIVRCTDGNNVEIRCNNEDFVKMTMPEKIAPQQGITQHGSEISNTLKIQGQNDATTAEECKLSINQQCFTVTDPLEICAKVGYDFTYDINLQSQLVKTYTPYQSILANKDVPLSIGLKDDQSTIVFQKQGVDIIDILVNDKMGYSTDQVEISEDQQFVTKKFVETRPIQTFPINGSVWDLGTKKISTDASIFLPTDLITESHCQGITESFINIYDQSQQLKDTIDARIDEKTTGTVTETNLIPTTGFLQQNYQPADTPLNEIPIPTATLDMNQQSIENLVQSTNGTSATTKNYVDNRTVVTLQSAQNYTDTQISNIDHSKIFNVGSKSQIQCKGDNEIEIKANNNVLGKIYQPVGQATNPLGIYSGDKIQIQSDLSSISVYGGKAIDPSLLVLNTNGFYVTGKDSSTANVQSLVNLQQGSSQLNLSAGHANFGAGQVDYQGISGTGNLSISGGNQISGDSYIQLLNNSQATTQNKMPITFSGKAGYSASTSITDSNQFASKAYVDSATGGGLPSNSTLNSIATTNPTSASVSLNSNKITNLADPTANADAANKSYVDTGLSGKLSSTATLNSISSANLTSGNVNLNSNKIINMSTPTLDSDASTKKYVDDGLGTKLSSTATLNSISAANATSASVSMNNNKITNLATATLPSDAVRLDQIPNISSGLFYTQTLETIAAGTRYTITHNLGLNLTQMTVRCIYQVKTAVSGYAVGDYIDTGNDIYIGSTASSGGGFEVSQRDTNSISISTGDASGGFIAYAGGFGFIPFVNVRMIIQISQVQNPQVLQANSLYSSQLLANSNIDLGSNKFLTSASSFTGNEIPNVAWIQANTQVGVPSKIQNANFNSSLTANATELTMGPTPLNMNLQKITGLTGGTNNDEAVNWGQLSGYFPVKILNSTRALVIDSTTLSMRDGSNPLPLVASYDGSNLYMNFNRFVFGDYTNQNNLLYMTNSRVNLARNVLISTNYNAGTSSTNPALAIDASLLSLQGAASSVPICDINNNNGSYPLGLRVRNSKCVFQDIESQSGQILFQSSTYPNIDTNYSNISKVSINVGGVGQYSNYGLFVQQGIVANVTSYNPGSSKIYKKDFRNLITDDLENVNMIEFKYDHDKCLEIGIFIPQHMTDFRRGFILEDCPNRYTREIQNGFTLDIDALKDDLLQYHQEQIRELKAQNKQLLNLVAELDSRLKKLEDKISNQNE